MLLGIALIVSMWPSWFLWWPPVKRDQEQHGAYADFVDILLKDFENARRQDRDEDQLNMRLEQNDAGEEGMRQVEESESASVTSESDVGADHELPGRIQHVRHQECLLIVTRPIYDIQVGARWQRLTPT